MRKNKLLNRVLALTMVGFFIIMNTSAYSVGTWEEATGDQKEAMLRVAESLGYTPTTEQWAEVEAQKAAEAAAAQKMAAEGDNNQQTDWRNNYRDDKDAYKDVDETESGTRVFKVGEDEMNNILEGTGYDTDSLVDATQEDLDKIAGVLGDGYVVVWNQMKRDGTGEQTKITAGGDTVEYFSNDTDVIDAETKRWIKLADGTFFAIYEVPRTPDIPQGIPSGVPTGIPSGVPTGVPSGIPTGHQHSFTTSTYTTKCTLDHENEEYGLKADGDWGDTEFTSGIDPIQSKERPLAVGSEFSLFGNIHVVRDIEQDVESGTQKCTTPLYKVTKKSCSCGYEYEVGREQIGVCGKPSTIKNYGDATYTEKMHSVMIEFVGFRVEGQGKTVKLGEEKTIKQKPTIEE